MNYLVFKEPSPAIPVLPRSRDAPNGYRCQPTEPKCPSTGKVAPIPTGAAPQNHRPDAPMPHPVIPIDQPIQPHALVVWRPPAPNNGPLIPMAPAWLDYTVSLPAPPMSHQSRLLLAGSVPNRSFTARAGAYDHVHPVSHAVRQWAYVKLLNYIASDANNTNTPITITDIGGHHSMPDVHPLAPVVHATKPYFDSADYHRTRNAAFSCACAFPANCPACANCTYLMSVHSLYYLNKDDICNAVQRAPLFAAVHIFDGLNGKHQELTWSRIGTKILMQQTGDSQHYSHDNIDWVFTKSMHISTTGNAMCWKLEAHPSGTYFVTFRRCPIDTAPAPAYYPDFNDTTYARALAGLTLHDPLAVRLSLWYYFIPKTQTVVHLELFEKLVDWWSSRTVDHINLRDGIGKATSLISSKGYTIPSTSSLHAHVALAAIEAAKRMSTAVTIIRESDIDLGVYNSYLNGTKPLIVSPYRAILDSVIKDPVRLGLTATTVFLLLVILKLRFQLFWRTFRFGRRPAMGSAFDFHPLLFAIFMYCYNWWNKKQRTKSWRSLITNFTKTVLPHTDFSLLRPGPTGWVVRVSHCVTQFFTPKPQHRNSKVTPNAALTEPCKPTIGAVLTGVAFSGWDTTVCRSCPHNEMAAIMNRVTAETRPAIATAPIGPLTSVPPSLVADAELAWRKGLVPAKDRIYQSWYRDEPINDEHQRAAHELFVKRENAIKGFGQHPESVEIRPRAIQTSTPYSNALLGPFISSFTKALENHVIHTSDTACFVYTKSPREISVYMSSVLGLFENPVFYSIDVASADASVSPAFNKVFREILSHAGASNEVISFVKQNLPITGTSKSGIKYLTDQGIPSGVQYTTTSHSVQALTIWDSLNYKPGEAFLFNKSDDNLVIVEASNQTPAIQFMLAMHDNGLGTTHTASHRIHNAEFLSMRFFGKYGRISCVPKIGRTMSKLFWSCYPTRIGDPLDHVATVCHGLRHLRSVPILGPLLIRCSQLSAGAKKDAPITADEWGRLFWVDVTVHRDDILAGFIEMYETTMAEILLVEQQISEIPSLPFVYTHPLVDRIIARDLGLEALPNEISTDAPAVYRPLHDESLRLAACSNPLFNILAKTWRKYNDTQQNNVVIAVNYLKNICLPSYTNPKGYRSFFPASARLLMTANSLFGAAFEEWLASKSNYLYCLYMMFEFAPKTYMAMLLPKPWGPAILIHNLFIHIGCALLRRFKQPHLALALHLANNAVVGWFGDHIALSPSLYVAKNLPPVVVKFLRLTTALFAYLTGTTPVPFD